MKIKTKCKSIFKKFFTPQTVPLSRRRENTPLWCILLENYLIAESSNGVISLSEVGRLVFKEQYQ
jgi:hypothetical protein